MKVFKTSAKVPTLDSMYDAEVFDDIQPFYDFYLESIQDRLNNGDDSDIKSEIVTPSGISLECNLSKENFHKSLSRCEEYFVMVEQYEKANECLKLLQKLDNENRK